MNWRRFFRQDLPFIVNNACGVLLAVHGFQLHDYRYLAFGAIITLLGAFGYLLILANQPQEQVPEAEA